ncbi:hypothetical protein GCM10008940_34690 [Microbulbifer agarilyticus]
MEPKGAQPKSPKVEFKVERGYSSEFDSCADTGTVTIKIDAQGYKSRSVGYVFEVISSSESQKIFPEEAVYGNAKSVNGVNTFTFPWIDGASDVQEPLEILVNIYRVNHGWVLSDPAQLVIRHRGRI